MLRSPSVTARKRALSDGADVLDHDRKKFRGDRSDALMDIDVGSKSAAHQAQKRSRS